MDAKVREVAKGFEYEAKSFKAYDMNGYRFHTDKHTRERPNRRSINSVVYCLGTDGRHYYGTIEEIYELKYCGLQGVKPIIFRCSWLNPEKVRHTPSIGFVEVERASKYAGNDVYIMAQQATQVFFLPYACTSTEYIDLLKWDVVYKVPPRIKVPTPNKDDYHINPNTYEGEFFQEADTNEDEDYAKEDGGVHHKHDAMEHEAMDDMEVDNAEDEYEDVSDPRDLALLMRWHMGLDEDEGPPEDFEDECMNGRDSDDESPDPNVAPNIDPYF